MGDNRKVSGRVSCVGSAAVTVTWWSLCLIPLGMLDEAEVFVGELGDNVEAGWRVAVSQAVLILSTWHVGAADLGMLCAAGTEEV